MLTDNAVTHASVFHYGAECGKPETTYTRYGPTRWYPDGSWRIPVRSGTGAYTYIRSRDAEKIHGILAINCKLRQV